jgi:hypothetical protein
MGADFTRNASGRRQAIRSAVLAGLAVLLIGFAGRPYLPAAAEWAVRQPLSIALLILDAHDKPREAAEKPGRDESGRPRQDRQEWLDALLRLLREPIVELRTHCRCQAGRIVA